MYDVEMMDTRNTRNSGLQSVSRAILVMRFLSRNGWSGVTEVANTLEIHKSTAYRLLSTLRDSGMVEQDVETDRYRLGMGLVSLASTVSSDFDVVRYARPICQRLSEQTGETVNISVMEGEEAVVVDQSVASSSMLSVDWSGYHQPLHCTAYGKVFLAHLPSGKQRRILSRRLQAPTVHTITDPELLRKQLQEIHDKGYAYTIEELEVGLNAVGAPIYNADGVVVAAVSVSGPAFRLTVDSIIATGELARDAADEISGRLRIC